MKTELIQWSEIQSAISIAENWDEIKQVETKLKAIQLIASQEKMAIPVKNRVVRYLIDIEAKKGEWLRDNVKHKGGQPKKEPLQDERVLLKDLKISHIESHRSQKLAEIPKEKRDEVLNEIEKEGKEITKTELTKRIKQEQRQAEIEQTKTEPIQTPEGLFDVIVIDPPWPAPVKEYNSQYFMGRTANPYPEMTIEEIKNFKIPASDNSILWLWTTHNYIWDAKEIMDLWKFDYKAILTWNKEKMGIGYWLRKQCEFCLLGLRGKPEWKRKDVRDIITEKRREHSRKPEVFYNLVEGLCEGRKIDIFSRNKRNGWYQYGNETTKFV